MGWQRKYSAVGTVTDTERLNRIEAAARKSVAALFGDDARCGFIVSEDGDVLSGTIEDYPHLTLRAAIDQMEGGR